MCLELASTSMNHPVDRVGCQFVLFHVLSSVRDFIVVSGVVALFVVVAAEVVGFVVVVLFCLLECFRLGVLRD